MRKLTREETNEKLREIIVDRADMWDGKESSKYGKRLQDILNSLDIKDTARYYSEYTYEWITDELKKKKYLKDDGFNHYFDGRMVNPYKMKDERLKAGQKNG